MTVDVLRQPAPSRQDVSHRLLTAAGLLAPYVHHYVADGKGGADWMPMKAVAHQLVMDTEDDAIDALKAC
ncbi:hypothetical protein ACH4Q6_07100 [Streptomyces lydicus]|uniref:hypothetical protein n=1 Tax=Streptomyces lydicus TaxID=47763 RepID=UPI00378D6313